MRKLNMFLYILFFICTVSIFAGQNIVINPDFETGNGTLPDGWTSWQWFTDTPNTIITWENSGAQSGSRCISIENKQKNDARLKQTIPVQENKKYRLACWIKAADVGADATGACISIWYRAESSENVKGTQTEWKQVEMFMQTGKGVNSIDLTVGVGGHGSENSGKAWFDNVTVEEVKDIPAGGTVAKVNAPGDNSTAADQTKTTIAPKKNSTPLVLLLVVLAVAIVAGAILLNIFGKNKKAKPANANDQEKAADNQGSEN